MSVLSAVLSYLIYVVLHYHNVTLIFEPHQSERELNAYTNNKRSGKTLQMCNHARIITVNTQFV